MRYLTLAEILDLHERLFILSGGSVGIRDLGALESSVNQPHASFGGEELYPDLVTKAASLCFSLVMNHPLLDGNKRVGHAAMEIFLVLNDHEINAGVDEQAKIILNMAAGDYSRDNFVDWLRDHTIKRSET
jgi:death on curing protein